MKRVFLRPDLIHCTVFVIKGRKTIKCYCMKHGTKITSAKLRRKFNLQSWWNWIVYPLWHKRICK